ncbi:TniQ family protein [Chryseobacterium arthrosphaerae]|uniref:TniQ family protein n=1 Tax=Chryseobacterium arthrosphaerae TaxID=651561 RepID=UPI0023E233DE|nr:TniQ family protein [Chryseobacterium arthrosphaerae]WES96520.1 TniQ family protein [Chryseobacterium arthrosphaerae]
MPHIQILDKNIWAHYTPPYQDELFTSWFFRLSQAHGVKSHSFAKYYFGKEQLWNRDIDNSASDYLKKVIVENSPLLDQDVENLFLTSYETILFEQRNLNGNTHGILPFGIYHRKRKNKSLLYCPSCIGKKPYYKKAWRLSISYFCTDCKILLKDCCESCGNGISFHRLEQGNKHKIQAHPLDTCYFCTASLSSNWEDANNSQILLQTKINSIVKDGYSKEFQYSFSYFKVLHIILLLISRKHNTWGRLRNACEFEFGPLPIEDGSWYLWSITNRRIIFETAFRIIEDFPFFQFLIQKHNLRLSEFKKDHILPYSFENIFKNI